MTTRTSRPGVRRISTPSADTCPYAHGVPGKRWLTILMNRINPGLFAAAFAPWVRESWPEKTGLVAIDGETSRRSHDRSAGAGPLHLVSAFAPPPA